MAAKLVVSIGQQRSLAGKEFHTVGLAAENELSVKLWFIVCTFLYSVPGAVQAEVDHQAQEIRSARFSLKEVWKLLSSKATSRIKWQVPTTKTVVSIKQS